MRRFNNLELGEQTTAAALSGQRYREPDHDDAFWLASAVEERMSGRHETALRYYSGPLELNRSLVVSWVGQVQMLIALGEYPEADVWSRKALELFKNNPDLLAGRAQSLCRRGDFSQAQASADAALAQPGVSGYPWLARGELMLARRQSTADYCFDKALHFSPEWLTRVEIGDVQRYYGRPAKALPHFRRATEQASDRAYCWLKQGQCELALGMTAPGARSFETCLQLVPHHADAQQALHAMDRNRKPVRNWLRRLFRRSR